MRVCGTGHCTWQSDNWPDLDQKKHQTRRECLQGDAVLPDVADRQAVIMAIHVMMMPHTSRGNVAKYRRTVVVMVVAVLSTDCCRCHLDMSVTADKKPLVDAGEGLHLCGSLAGSSVFSCRRSLGLRDGSGLGLTIYPGLILPPLRLNGRGGPCPQ